MSMSADQLDDDDDDLPPLDALGTVGNSPAKALVAAAEANSVSGSDRDMGQIQHEREMFGDDGDDDDDDDDEGGSNRLEDEREVDGRLAAVGSAVGRTREAEGTHAGRDKGEQRRGQKSGQQQQQQQQRQQQKKQGQKTQANQQQGGPKAGEEHASTIVLGADDDDNDEVLVGSLSGRALARVSSAWEGQFYVAQVDEVATERESRAILKKLGTRKRASPLDLSNFELPRGL